MTRILLRIPTINDKLRDFDQLFTLWDEVNGDSLDVTLDFSQCGFLRQNAVAFLGGLARMVEHRRGVCRMNWESLRPDVAGNLAKNGFRDAFGDPTPHGVGQSIPYRQDTVPDKKALMGYLKAMWLGRGWVNVSPLLRDRIVGVVWEIYANAFEHAQSPIGLFSCGQHFPRRKVLSLTVTDFGVGIPSNVRRFCGDASIPADRVMEWAFRPGTTTKPNGMGRGMGLDLLRQFVRLNTSDSAS